MKKTVWITGITLVALALIGAGFLTGRQFPAHHFEKDSAGPYLFDSATGRVCAMFPDGVYDATGKRVDPTQQTSAWVNQALSGLPTSGGSTLDEYIAKHSDGTAPIPLCNGK